MGRLGDLLSELRQDLDDAKRDRERILDARLTGDPAEAQASQLYALAANDKHIQRYEANLAEAEAEVVELPVCWCGHYAKEHAPGGYGEQTGPCLHCPCDGYAGP